MVARHWCQVNLMFDLFDTTMDNQFSLLLQLSTTFQSHCSTLSPDVAYSRTAAHIPATSLAAGKVKGLVQHAPETLHIEIPRKPAI